MFMLEPPCDLHMPIQSFTLLLTRSVAYVWHRVHDFMYLTPNTDTRAYRKGQE